MVLRKPDLRILQTALETFMHDWDRPLQTTSLLAPQVYMNTFRGYQGNLTA